MHCRDDRASKRTRREMSALSKSIATRAVPIRIGEKNVSKRYRNVDVIDDDEEAQLEALRRQRNQRCNRHAQSRESARRKNKPILDHKSGKQVPKNHRNNKLDAKLARKARTENAVQRNTTLRHALDTILACDIADFIVLVNGRMYVWIDGWYDAEDFLDIA